MNLETKGGRKGQFTVANLLGVAVLLFIFMVMSGPILDALSRAFTGAGVMTQAVLVTLVPTILFVIIGSIWTMQQPEYEGRPRQQRQVRRVPPEQRREPRR